MWAVSGEPPHLDDPPPPAADEHGDPSDQSPPQAAADNATSAGSRRAWGVVLGVVAVGFVALVVSSARTGSVPVGASGSMPGMSMGGSGQGMSMTLRDLNGRRLSIPGGRPGVVVFVNARGCTACLSTVRVASQALTGRYGRTQLLVVAVDAGTARDQLTAFARQVGGQRARYVVDDRNGALARMFDASGLGAAVIYDRGGRVVGHPAATVAALRRSLARVS